MTDRIGRADYELGADRGPLKRELAAAEGDLRASGARSEREVAASANRSVSKMTELSSRARTIIGGGIGAGFSSAIAGASALEDQLTTINTVARLPHDALKQMGDDIQALARETGKPTAELTAGMYDLVSAGVPADQAINVLRDSAKLATGALGTTGEAVDLVTSAMNAYGLKAGDSTRITDIFAKAVADGKVTASELGSSIANIAPIAAAAGVSLEEVSAGYALMTAKGTPAAQVATQMRASISALLTPNIALNKIQKETNQNFAEMAKERGLAVALEELRKSVGGNEEQFAKALGSMEAYQFALASTGENAEAFAAQITETGNASGLAGEQYDIASSSSAAQSRRLAQEIRTLGQEIGGPFVDNIGIALGALGEFGGGNTILIQQLLGTGIGAAAGRAVPLFAAAGRRLGTALLGAVVIEQGVVGIIDAAAPAMAARGAAAGTAAGRATSAGFLAGVGPILAFLAVPLVVGLSVQADTPMFEDAEARIRGLQRAIDDLDDRNPMEAWGNTNVAQGLQLLRAEMAALQQGNVDLADSIRDGTTTLDQATAQMVTNWTRLGAAADMGFAMASDAVAGFGEAADMGFARAASAAAGAVAEVERAGPVWHAATVNLSGHLPDAVKEAIGASKTALRNAPNEFADSLLTAQRAWTDAVAGLASGLTKPMSVAAERAGLEIVLFGDEATDKLVTELNSSEPAIRSAAQAQYDAWMKRYQDPETSPKDRLLLEGRLGAVNLKLGLASEDANIHGWAVDQQEDLYARWAEVASDAYGYGAAVVTRLANGMTANEWRLYAASLSAAAAISGYIHLSQPPPGPLNTVDEWMPHLIDRLVGSGRAHLGKLTALSGSIAAALRPSFAGGFAGVSGAAFSPGGSTSSIGGTATLRVEVVDLGGGLARAGVRTRDVVDMLEERLTEQAGNYRRTRRSEAGAF